MVTGNLTTGNTKTCGCSRIEVGRRLSREGHPQWQQQVKYAAAHIRVQVAKGAAAEHACVDCGLGASDWSYEGGDLDELVEIINGYPRRYSLDPDRYQPRCRSCHRIKDNRERVKV